MQGGVVGSLCFLAFLLSTRVEGSGQVAQDLSYGEQQELFDDSDATYGLGSIKKVDDDDSSAEERSAYSSARSRVTSGLNPGLMYGSQYPQSYGPSTGNAYAQALAESEANSYSPGLYGPLYSPGNGLSQAEALARAQSQAYAQAQAQAQAQTQAQAQALALAQAYAKAQGEVQSQAHAQAQAIANSQSNYESGLLGPYNPSAGLSYAQGQALANDYGGGGYSPYYLGPNVGSTYSEAEANALAQALSQAGLLTTYPNYINSAEANALSHAFGGGLGSSPDVFGQGYNLVGGQSQAQAYSQAQSQTQSLGQYPAQASSLAAALADSQLAGSGQSAAYAKAFAGARTRVVPAHEYVLPYDIPGGDQIIRCSREGELHNFWSSEYQCLVCACINQNGYLTPVCTSCAGCMVPPGPPPDLIPPIPPTPAPILPLQPEPQASCYPLPTETPFENPLNPCQICVCHLTLDGFGQPDVQIACQENPNCSITDIIVPIPSRYLPPVPITMPQCGRFPPNVPFPHPNDACSVCQCIVDRITSDHEIICYPKHDCDTPVGPGRTPVYPPAIIKPLPPGPLPGPPPHQSCRPYVPQQPFAHPWDECQECVCTELHALGVINVEVNCYTKTSCCIEAPQLPQILPVPEPYGNVVYIEPRCRYRAPLQPFVSDCNVCTCVTVYNYVIAKCDRQPGCGFGPLNTGSSYSNAAAHANAQTNSYLPYNYNSVPLDFTPLSGSSYSSAEAAALANSNAQVSPLEYNPLYQSNAVLSPYLNPSEYNPMYGDNLRPGDGYLHGLSEANAIANANTGYNQLYGSSASAQANALSNVGLNPLRSQSYLNLSPQYQAGAEAQALANANSGYNPLLSGFDYVPGNSGFSANAEALANSVMSPYSGSSASAVADAEVASGLNPSVYQLYPTLHPSYQPGYSGSAEAEALASTNLGYNQLNPGYGSTLSALTEAVPYSNSGYNRYLPGYQYGSASSANAEAIANANVGYNQPGLYPGAPSSALLSNYGSANALSEASSNANSYPYSGNSPYGASYPYLYGGSLSSASAEAEAIANSNLNAGLSPQMNPLYQTGLGNSATAQAFANSGQGQASAQSLSQASALSGRPLIKSGPGQCKYLGDKYHHSCQACYCLRDDDGRLVAFCLGNPCA